MVTCKKNAKEVFLNGYNIGFRPQTLKLELHNMSSQLTPRGKNVFEACTGPSRFVVIEGCCF